MISSYILFSITCCFLLIAILRFPEIERTNLRWLTIIIGLWHVLYKLMQLRQAILEFAEGLRVLGILPNERVSLFADNSCRWLVADQGKYINRAVIYFLFRHGLKTILRDIRCATVLVRWRNSFNCSSFWNLHAITSLQFQNFIIFAWILYQVFKYNFFV